MAIWSVIEIEPWCASSTNEALKSEPELAWNDAVEEPCQNGIGTIAQPGGSRRDGAAVGCCKPATGTACRSSSRDWKELMSGFRDLKH
uniref:Uncharacterized protein n=1 Tax=Setaria viridis TaxID=4556 RepID=A0A4U6TW98_SETVI|nr:hypothetical protein SEVIR_7G247500v2 [Setaria viridis]